MSARRAQGTLTKQGEPRRPKDGGAPYFFVRHCLLDLQMLSRFHTARANLRAGAVRRSRPLEIGLTATFADRVELRGSNTVGVSSTDLRSLFTYRTLLCHTIFGVDMVTYRVYFASGKLICRYPKFPL